MWSHGILRAAAFGTALLLGVSWTMRALYSMDLWLFDLGTSGTGEVIMTVASLFDLAPAATLKFAYALTGVKLLIGIYLFAGVIFGLYELAVRGETDDTLLDAMLILAAIAAATAAMGAILGDGSWLHVYLGELFLCLAASVFAALSRARQPHIEADAEPSQDATWRSLLGVHLGRAK
jgi:hypothetical protein